MRYPHLSMSTITLLCCALLTDAAFAQDTIALYGDNGSGLRRFVYTDDSTFDVVVMLNAQHPIEAAEFAIAELAARVPGVFRIGVTTTGEHIDTAPSGEDTMYLVYSTWAGRGDCWEGGFAEVLRMTYLDLSGTTLTDDVVLTLRGLTDDDPLPSSFGGHPGYVECPCSVDFCDTHVLGLEPWSEYGMPDNEDLAGAVVLNPSWFPVENAVSSLSALKSRF